MAEDEQVTLRVGAGDLATQFGDANSNLFLVEQNPLDRTPVETWVGP